MLENEGVQEIYDLPEEPWEEIALNLLHESKIDQDLSNDKARKWLRKKLKGRWMKRPMAIPQLILDLQEEKFREPALRLLSAFLLERREEDPDNYYRTGILLYNSCSTMAILIQEVVSYYTLMIDNSLNGRASHRLANVLGLFQCIAANKEMRQKFVQSCVPNFLVPLILFEASAEDFENVRAVALSVVGILCQAREPNIIQWAVESNMMEVCRIGIENGNELSKVVQAPSCLI